MKNSYNIFKRNKIDDLNSKTIIALGDFDGMHPGHMDVLTHAIQNASTLNINSAVFIFKEALYKHDPCCGQLMTNTEKMSYFWKIGFDYIIMADFESYRYLKPFSFMQDVLCNMFHCVGVSCGYDYHFGIDGIGTITNLQDFFGEENVYIAKPFQTSDNITVHSTFIRNKLYNNDLEKANELMGHPFGITGTVQKGTRIGHQFGFPTANITWPSEKVKLSNGVYATIVKYNNILYRAVTDLGSKPTVSNHCTFICETHIIDFSDENLYGKDITIYFIKKLRDEIHFDNTSLLKQAISHDVNLSKNISIKLYSFPI